MFPVKPQQQSFWKKTSKWLSFLVRGAVLPLLDKFNKCIVQPLSPEPLNLKGPLCLSNAFWSLLPSFHLLPTLSFSPPDFLRNTSMVKGKVNSFYIWETHSDLPNGFLSLEGNGEPCLILISKIQMSQLPAIQVWNLPKIFLKIASETVFRKPNRMLCSASYTFAGILTSQLLLTFKISEWNMILLS